MFRGETATGRYTLGLLAAWAGCSFRRSGLERLHEGAEKRKGLDARVRRVYARARPRSSGASLCRVMGGQCVGRKKPLTARLPILAPCSIPSSTALRKWKPTRIRESPFSAAAWEKLV